MRNDSGKAVTIFLILIAVILISLTAISVFLLVKQTELRRGAEENVEQLKSAQSTLRAELQEANKQKEILEFRVKESEDKLEGVLEELDLAQGVRDEVRKENRELKESLDVAKKANEEVKAQLAQKEEAAELRVTELQTQLDVALQRNKELEQKRQDLEKEYNQLKTQLLSYQSTSVPVDTQSSVLVDDGVDLVRIVVNASDVNQGRVISVDQEAEFVIINLGERHGAVVDKILSVYADNKYIGDLKVTKVLPEMSAADINLPLTSQDISEGDIVKFKE